MHGTKKKEKKSVLNIEQSKSCKKREKENMKNEK